MKLWWLLCEQAFEFNRLIVARLPEDRLHLHGEHVRYDETPLNVVRKSSESVPSFDAPQVGVEGDAEPPLKVWARDLRGHAV